MKYWSKFAKTFVSKTPKSIVFMLQCFQISLTFKFLEKPFLRYPYFGKLCNIQKSEMQGNLRIFDEKLLLFGDKGGIFIKKKMKKNEEILYFFKEIDIIRF